MELSCAGLTLEGLILPLDRKPGFCRSQTTIVELALQFAQAEFRRRNSTREIPMAFFVVNCDLRRKDEFDYQELWDEFTEVARLFEPKRLIYLDKPVFRMIVVPM